jgi:hypothetical protein
VLGLVVIDDALSFLLQEEYAVNRRCVVAHCHRCHAFGAGRRGREFGGRGVASGGREVSISAQEEEGVTTGKQEGKIL